jgi:anti-sigma factor RsiW
MNEPDGLRLMEYLDGRLDAGERAEVEAWLARDPEARSLCEQHRRLWAELATLPQAPVEASEEFRRTTLRRAEEERRAPVLPLRGRGLTALAASLLLAVAGWTWWSAQDRAARDATDRELIGHLHVLQEYDFLSAHAVELDIAVQSEILRHFEGELPREGRR